jgi:hypothetical protein
VFSECGAARISPQVHGQLIEHLGRCIEEGIGVGTHSLFRRPLPVRAPKPSSRRISMEDVGPFTVENAKVVREEFFYSAG